MWGRWGSHACRLRPGVAAGVGRAGGTRRGPGRALPAGRVRSPGVAAGAALSPTRGTLVAWLRSASFPCPPAQQGAAAAAAPPGTAGPACLRPRGRQRRAGARELPCVGPVPVRVVGASPCPAAPAGGLAAACQAARYFSEGREALYLLEEKKWGF